MVYEHLSWRPENAGAPVGRATVAVITRDRPEDLATCLTALLSMPDDGQEMVVVDNCPATDATRDLVARYGDRVRYVRETTPGASAARNRALREARHAIVAFSDDDAVPDSEWLRALTRNFSDRRVLCTTGLIMPLELETPAQEEFERYSPHGRGFRRQVFDQRTHYPLHVSPAGVSAGMALRRDVLELVGPFNEALGPGTPSRAGEDYDLFARILKAGYRIVYDPAALSWHRHRRTERELREALHGYGIAVYAWWTHQLVFDKEWSVPLLAWGWFRHKQGPALLGVLLRRPGRTRLELLLAELCGCVRGPWAYFQARRRLRTLRSAS
jgi:GT2 family glycosyltransferase